MMSPREKPLLFIVSAPSGAGKTTLGNLLLNEFQNMTRSISCTTRPRREGEVDGRDYLFLSVPEFKKRLLKGYFLEAASVHGNWYGTPRRPLERALAGGKDILMVIDVQGAGMVRKSMAKAGKNLKAAFVDVFVLPPSVTELKRRLMRRGKDQPREIAIRLKNAKREMRDWRAFRYVVINDRLEQAYKRLRSIVIAEHCRI